MHLNKARKLVSDLPEATQKDEQNQIECVIISSLIPKIYS